MKDTMTVIELLNDIVNGKEVPDYIIWDERIYEKNLETDYTCYTPNEEPRYFLNEVLLCELNDKVKIPNIKLAKAEENIKNASSVHSEIKELENLNCTYTDLIDSCEIANVRKEYIIADIQTLQKWINKIIKEINKEDK